MSKTNSPVRRIIKVVSWTLSILVVLFALLVLGLRTPQVQTRLTGFASDWLASKTGAQLSIDQLYLTFRGDLQIDKLFLATSAGDTLIYSEYLEVGASLPALLDGDVSLTRINWQGVIADIKADESGNFNFQFIIDAFDTGEQQTSESSPAINLELGPIALQNIRVRYFDDQNKIDIKTYINQLSLAPQEVNLDNMIFHIADGAIAGADIEVIQFGTATSSSESDSGTSLLPQVMVDAISIKNIGVLYASYADSLRLSTQVGDLALRQGHLDLNTSSIVAEALTVDASQVAVVSSGTVQPSDIEQVTPVFAWPVWSVDLELLAINNTSFGLEMGPANENPLFIDPNQMDWNLKSVNASNIHFAPDDIQVDLNELSIREKNQNFQLSGGVTASLDEQNIDLTDLHLSTLHSQLITDINIGYQSFDSLINHAHHSRLSTDIKELTLGSGDLRQLSFLVAEQPSLAVFLGKSLGASGILQYSAKEIKADGLGIFWSDQTQLTIDGQLTNPFDSSLISLALDQFRFATRGQDMRAIKSAFDLPVDLPNQIALNGHLNASLTHADGNLSFQSNEGSAMMSINMSDSLSIPVYRTSTSFKNIDLGKWLQTEQLGKINGSLSAAGQGTTLDQMIANAQLSISKIELLDQQMDSINIGLALDSGRYSVDVNVVEPSIVADLTGQGKFISVDQFTSDIQLSLGQIDLQTWQLAEDSILVSSYIDLQLQRSAAQNQLALKVTDSKFQSATEQHLLKPISINLTSSRDTTHFGLVSGLFVGGGQVNTSIEDLMERSGQWTEDTTTGALLDIDALLEGIVASAKINFNPTSDQFEQIWPQLDIEDSISLSLAINQPAKDYQMTLLAPSTTYKRQHLTHLEVRLFNQRDSIHYEFGFEELQSGPAQIGELSSNGWILGQQWHNALTIAGSTDHPIIQVDTESHWVADTLYTHIVPESLLLDSLSWSLPPDNRIAYYDGSLLFKDFVLQHEDDLLEISSSVINEALNLDLRFENFQIGTLTSMINASAYPATGEVNGYVDINGLETHPTVVADLTVDDLVVLNEYIGALKWNSKSDEASGSLINLSANSPELEIKVNGTLDENGALDLQMRLEKIAMSMIEGFSNGAISKTTGYIAGNLHITGFDSLPQYRGTVDFHDASLVVTDINAPFSLEDESIMIDNELISFNNFTVRDEQSNILELNGKISVDDLADPSFDFHILGKNFQMLNSTVQDNDQYYGKVDIDIDLAVKGRQSAPTVDVTARLNKGSNFTYVLPESQLEIEEREGVIMFFNQNDSSTLNEPERKQPRLFEVEGVQLTSKLTIDPETNFKMIIDKRSGDFLEIGGEANLAVNMDRKGKITMNGTYTAGKGAYEVRLYEIVQRRFEVVPGSRIIWTGDPYKAELDLTAQYNLRTSVRELMAEQVASADATTKVASQQDLPFEVLLNIQGSLDQPLMSFKLDMPMDVRNELGGNIYARINQINANEDELNKQVFSLVAFNQFLPSEVANASGNSTSNIAKSSVNQILSSQLNNLSQRYIKGIDVDFNLNSVSDYQSGSPEERTELSVSIKKALFDDRVIISVGNSVDIEGQSRQTNEWVDDVSIEYKLTDDGRYRLKGFQKNSFEDLVEGQVTITGLALLFSKEFDHFRNIFNSTAEVK